jgi:hypothetical protein
MEPSQDAETKPELSAEDRRRIYEEEKARIEASAASSAKSRRPRTVLWVLSRVCAALLIALGLALLIYLAARNPADSKPSAGSSAPGAVPLSEASENEFTADLAGQLRRIDHEGGESDEAILNNLEEVDNKVTYAHLEKNAGRYAGKAWAVQGKILQIFENNDGTQARIGFGSWNNDVIYAVGRFTTEFIENDRVYVIGYLAGNYSYESQAGWNITIPLLAARAMLRPAELQKIKISFARKRAEAEAAANPGSSGASRNRDDSLGRRKAEAERLLNQ